MTKEKKNENTKCSKKKGLMFAYGFIQLGASSISAISLAAIALSFCSLKYESKVFNECVNESIDNGKSTSLAVNFCNGGKQ